MVINLSGTSWKIDNIDFGINENFGVALEETVIVSNFSLNSY